MHTEPTAPAMDYYDCVRVLDALVDAVRFAHDEKDLDAPEKVTAGELAEALHAHLVERHGPRTTFKLSWQMWLGLDPTYGKAPQSRRAL